jgi:geranylgeranyl diphosphate synthase type II
MSEAPTSGRTAPPPAAYPDDLHDLVEAYLGGLRFATVPGTEGLDEAMRYSLLAGGKRIRPVLALATARSLGAAPESVLPAAAAIELIHTYSLIHDDLPAMDDDELRRGRPTSHVVFGENVAILAGDGLFAEALRLFAERQPGDPGAVLAALGELLGAVGVEGMVGGQYMDVTMTMPAASSASRPGAAGSPPASSASRPGAAGSPQASSASRPGAARFAVDDSEAADELRRLHALKTGRLIAASVCVVLALERLAEAETIPYRRFADELGVLFQIVDDVLDVTGSDEELGKPRGSDERHGKVTYVSVFGLERARQLAGDSHRRAHQALEAVSGDSRDLSQITDFIYTRHA